MCSTTTPDRIYDFLSATVNISHPATDPVLVAFLEESAKTDPIQRDAVFSKYSKEVLGVVNVRALNQC